MRRALKPRSRIDLASNDYLGFAGDPELAERFRARLVGLPVGAAGSRLLRGELPIHAEAERALADFAGAETALLFPSGYQANLALLTALLRPGDSVFSDALNHASIIDAVRLSGARKMIYSHADAAALARALAAAPGEGLKLIVTESRFSMDGDVAPLTAIAALAKAHDALLVVDEAHAVGLHGEFAAGRAGGFVDELGLRGEVFATIHTGGKALGAGGAWVAGGPELRDHLVNLSRPFIFSTGVIPALAALLIESVARWRAVGSERARETLRRAKAARAALRAAAGARAEVPAGDGPILPVIVGSNERALAVAAALQAGGFDVRAVRPPTVPAGTARLRLTVTWPVAEADWARLPAALERALD